MIGTCFIKKPTLSNNVRFSGNRTKLRTDTCEEMKNYASLPLLLSLTFLFQVTTTNAQNTYKALFLGNSYTASNNLPNLVASIANSLGDSLIYDSNTPGGHTLQGHSTNATSISKINSQDWDFVVMQEQSQLPSFPQAQVATQVYPYATQLVNLIKQNDSCTEPVFFMTWGRRFGDSQNCPTWPPVCSFDGMQAQLRQSYLQMANDNNATCAPVGASWKHSIDTDPAVVLHSGDNSHPGLEGSYLAACVFYATLYRKSPVGASFTSTLTAAQANYLQQIAEDVAFDSMAVFNIGANIPTAGFNCSLISGTTYQFSSTSTNASTYSWNFGDGSPASSQQSLTHTFSGAGTYDVVLTASDSCSSHAIMKTLVVSPFVGIETIFNEIELSVFPNPSSGKINIKLEGLQSEGIFEITDMLGKIIHSEVVPEGNITFQKVIDLSANATGIYHYRLTHNGRQYTGKLIRE
jgi:PKD repeat protein